MIFNLVVITFVAAATPPSAEACAGLTAEPGGGSHAVEVLERFDESRWAWLIGRDTGLTLDGVPTGQTLHVYGAPDFAMGVPGLRLADAHPEPPPSNTLAARLFRSVRGVFDLDRIGASGGPDPARDEGAVFLHFADTWSIFPLTVRRTPGRFGAEPPPAPVLGPKFVTALGEARRRLGARDPAGEQWRAEVWAIPRPQRPGVWSAEDTRALANLTRRLQRLAPGVRFTVRAAVRGPNFSRGPLYFVTRLSTE